MGSALAWVLFHVVGTNEPLPTVTLSVGTLHGAGFSGALQHLPAVAAGGGNAPLPRVGAARALPPMPLTVWLDDDVVCGRRKPGSSSNGTIGSANATAAAAAAPLVPRGGALLVRRLGTCDFEAMADVARMAGARLLIVASTLRGMYGGRSTLPPGSYDCAQGSSYVPNPASPPWSDHNQHNACARHAPCAALSGVCGVAAAAAGSRAGAHYCCAWDWYVFATLKAPPPRAAPLTVVYVTMAHGAELLAAAQADAAVGKQHAVRAFDVGCGGRFECTWIAAVAMWALAVAVVAWASKAAADGTMAEKSGAGDLYAAHYGEGEPAEHAGFDSISLLSSPEPSTRSGSRDDGDGGRAPRRAAEKSEASVLDETIMSLTPCRAVCIVCAMGLLLLLFDALRPVAPNALASHGGNADGSLSGGRPNSMGVVVELKAALGWLLHTAINVSFASGGSLLLWQKIGLPVAWWLCHAAARCVRPNRSPQRRHECLHALSITFNNSGVARGFSLKLIDLASLLLCMLLGTAWLVLRVLRWHSAASLVAEAALQDLLCAALVAGIVALLQADALKVAVALLSVALFYDVFFVFVSPLIFGHSVMMAVAQGGARGGEDASSVGATKVATGGGAGNFDALNPPPGELGLGGVWDLDADSASTFVKTSFCAVHPGASLCPAPRGLPMMLTIPAALGLGGGGGDGYAHQSAMLGLGDLVIPSVLLCFTRRYDIAMGGASFRGGGSLGGGGGRGAVASIAAWLRSCSRGYFGLALGGYALGLALAFATVHLSGRAQPALLYLSPCVATPVLLVSWRKGLLPDMWAGTGLGVAAGGDGGGSEVGGGGGGHGGGARGASERAGFALFGAKATPPKRRYGDADADADADAASEGLFVRRGGTGPGSSNHAAGDALLARFSSAPDRGNINLNGSDDDWLDGNSYEDEPL